MIDLFEHNQKAYESAVSMLSEVGKAAVIHPTGTGKSFIGFKLCEDSPGKTVCWLSPSEYIFKTQLENIKSICGYEPTNIKFYTYAKLMLMSEDEIKEIQPDICIYDEYHRAGAPFWSVGVCNLERIYPDVPKLGLTATDIRYLDNQRNMSEELFENHIASEMTLGEAVVLGILSAPKYIQTVYSYTDTLKKYEYRVSHAQNKAVKSAGEKYLEALRRAIEKSEGLDAVFDRHMTDRTGKYLVFCATKEHMDEMQTHVGEWFSKIDSRPRVYTMYSLDPSADGQFAAFKEDCDNTHLRLLFCIDALNEGIHVDDISGVILLRPTLSPIIYKQQIGRALSAGKKKEPVIFDIVNNVDNLYSVGMIEDEIKAAITYYNYFGDSKSIVNEGFKVFDEVKNCRRLFEQLDSTLGSSWNLMYEKAVEYHKAYGNLDAAKAYRTEDGYTLGAWLQQQRGVRSGRLEGSLTKERIEKLDKLGMRWEALNDVSWKRHLDAYRRYVEAGNSLQIPHDYVSEDGVRIGSWILMLRRYKKSGIRSNYFTPEREKAVEAIGIIWDQPDYLWERNYAALLAYHKKHGNAEVPSGFVQDGVKLYNWLSDLRKAYRGYEKGRHGSLSDEQIARLNVLGVRWQSKSDLAWEKGLEKAREYSDMHGKADAPLGYVTKDGYKLGVWLSKCREKYAKGTLSDIRIAELKEINMVWNKSRENSWDDCYALCRKYYEENGNISIPSDYTAEGIWLSKWLNEQRQIILGKRKNKQLTPEQVEKLRQISFSADTQPDVRWDSYYNKVKDYLESNSSSKLPLGFTDSEGHNLYNWLSSQKRKYKKGEIGTARAQKLQEIGVV